MIRPTIEKMDEIIGKLRELRNTIATIEDKPLEFQEHKENDDKSVSIEQIIGLVAGQGLSGNNNELQKTLTQSEEMLECLFLSRNALIVRIITKLPTLPMDTLKKLRTDDIPELLCIDSVAKVKKQVWQGESPLTIEAQNLHFIRKEIDKQIEKNIEAAKAARRQKHVRPLISEVERVLFPFWDYFKEHGSYGRSENLILMGIIRQGNLSDLPEVINEFKRIKYKLEVESQQSAHIQPAEAGPERKSPGQSQKRGKAGRPRVSKDEAVRRREIKADWERYRESVPEARKELFCKDEGIAVEELQNVLHWCRCHSK